MLEVFLKSWFIVLIGFFVYNWASQQAIPQFPEFKGYIQNIIGGIVGAFAFYFMQTLSRKSKK